MVFLINFVILGMCNIFIIIFVCTTIQNLIHTELFYTFYLLMKIWLAIKKGGVDSAFKIYFKVRGIKDF